MLRLSSAFAGAAFVLSACSPGAAPPSAAARECVSRASPAIGGPISLRTHLGEAVTEADFKGRKSLVFFGYTHCPDFCPATLYLLGTAMRQLPEGTPAPRTILISVDPERDTPETLATYIQSNGFPSDIMALTGAEEDLHAAARAFGPDFSREPAPEGRSGYLVGHGLAIYLMDEDWKLETFFTPDARPADIAACIAELARD